MANEKRLIDANALMEKAEWYEDYDYCTGEYVMKKHIDIEDIEDAPTVDAVEVVQFNALKSLVNGEWVDCKLVEEALGIDFATGLKMFDFSRIAEWNPYPLNGQKITTKFKLKNAVVHGHWCWEGRFKACSKCGSHVEWEETLGASFWKFCPYCGTKMDMEVDK